MALEEAATREQLMTTPSLYELLCERLAEEYARRWDKSHAAPPVFVIAVTAVIGTILLAMGRTVWMLFAALTAGQIIWAASVALIRSSHNVDEKKKEIMRGKIPVELLESTQSHLRWWHHLLHSTQWAKHSRIYEHENRLTEHGDEIQQRLSELEAEAAAVEPEPEMYRNDPNYPGEENLSGGVTLYNDPVELAEGINNARQRTYHRERIEKIPDEKTRLEQEFVLIQAFLYKVQNVTHKLQRLEEIDEDVPDCTRNELNEMIRRYISNLEERRMILAQVDKIRPGELMQLTGV